MPLKRPESMEELVYFTSRDLADGGEITAWVYKEKCPECGKGLMGKPKDEKTGKPKTRAKEYVCEDCGHTVEKDEYEDTLTAQVEYKCPHCGKDGEAEVSFKRKKFQIFDVEKQKKVTVDAIRIPCGSCSKNIDLTKKMK